MERFSRYFFISYQDMPPPEIYSFNVYSDIQFRYARTLVTSKIVNHADVSQELSFEVVLPENAFITGFLM